MKKSLLTVAVSVVLAAAMLVGAPVAMAAAGDPLDLKKPNILTVHLPSAFAADFAKDPLEPEDPEAKDPHALGIQVDLYLVADAAKVPGQDAYTFTEFLAPFTALKESYGEGFTDPETAAGSWAAMSTEAALALFPKGKLTEETVISFQATVGEDGTAVFGDADLGKGLNPGLYLMVAHEPEADPADYVRIDDGENAESKIVTMAYSALNEYSFTPALISLPARGQDGDPNEGYTGGNTAAENGAWQYEADATLKGTHQPRYGSIEIVKTLLTGMTGSEPATFVFEVTVTTPAGPGGEPESETYTRTTGITFNGPNKQWVEMDRIPVGSTVTVKEVYSGASYTLTGPDDSEQTVSAAEIVEFNFTNEPTTDHRGGSGIVNSFELGAEQWTWQQRTWTEGPAPEPGE